MSIKLLAKETAIYGISSILGRMLNWMLVPLYTRLLTDTADYGVVTNLYTWVAFLMVLLTYGLETGFFRFANKEAANVRSVFSTAMISISSTAVLFGIAVACFIRPVTAALDYQHHEEIVLLMLPVLVLDLIMTIPFCYLRYQSKAMRFAGLKLLFIALNIGLNLFLLLLLPVVLENYPQWRDAILTPGYEVRFIILANLISTSIQFLCIIPTISSGGFRFDNALLRSMLRYSLPLLVLGIAGMMNQTADKILLPILIENKAEALSLLGIYGANFKIAVIMVMFAQAFRFAYEPYFFSQSKNKQIDIKKSYADVMKYFILFGLVIFLGVVFFMDILKFFIGKNYHEGLDVVPVVMMTELMFGVFFNLSVWYKLTDKTKWGAYLSIAGAVMTVTLNILFVPSYGYWACAWASFASYLLMTITSYAIGQRFYPIAYDLRRMGGYLAAALLLFISFRLLPLSGVTERLTVGTLFILAFVLLIGHFEFRSTIIKLVRR